MKVTMKTWDLRDAVIDTEEISHILPSQGTPGRSVVYSKKTGEFLYALEGDPLEVAEKLGFHAGTAES